MREPILLFFGYTLPQGQRGWICQDEFARATILPWSAIGFTLLSESETPARLAVSTNNNLESTWVAQPFPGGGNGNSIRLYREEW
jgi:hypothetical protein